MASYQEVVRRRNGYLHTLAVTLTGQDINANQSRLHFKYSIYYDGKAQYGGWTQLHNTPFNWQVGSTTGSSSPNFDFRANRTFVVVEGDTIVQHDANGNASVPMRFIAGQLPGSIQFTPIDSGFEYMGLTAIPRSSALTVEPNSVYEGGTFAIHLDRKVGSYTHHVLWSASNGQSGEVANGVGTDTTWSPPEGLLGTDKRVTVTIKAQTYSGSTPVGNLQTKDVFVLEVPEPEGYPTLGEGLPFDLRVRRLDVEGNKLVPQETIPFVKAVTNDTASASPTLDLTVTSKLYGTSLENQVVVVDFFDGEQWIKEGLPFVLTRSQDDQTDITETVQYTGLGYGDYLLSKLIVWDDREWAASNAGWVISQYMNEGKGRGWGPFIDRDFDYLITSDGTPWANPVTPNISKTTPVSQLLEGYVSDVLAEYRTQYRESSGTVWISMFNPGHGLDWTSEGANPVIDFGDQTLFKVATSAPVRKDYSNQLTRINAYGDETGTTRENASAINPKFGHLEGSLQASGVKDQNELNGLGDAALAGNQGGTIERTYEYDLSSTNTARGVYPYRTFRPGDYVLVPGNSGSERLRVAQVAITREGNNTTVTVALGDLIPNGAAATARKLAQAGGSAIAGGTLRSPTTIANSIPIAPTNLVATPDGYWDPSGSPVASVHLTWNPVTSSLAGTSLVVDLYEVWVREEVGSPWLLATTSNIAEAEVGPLPINVARDIHVRARTVGGVYGDYSDTETIITPLPDELLAAPSAPILDSDAVGTVTVKWDGTIQGSTPPPWFNYVIAEISTAENGAYTVAGSQLTQAGTLSIANIGAGTFWFRLVGYDKLNQRGATSSKVQITVTPEVGDNRVPKAPTAPSATSQGYWDGSTGLSSVTATWTAVTQDTDNGPIGVPVYELWGKVSTDDNYRSLGTTTTTSITIAPIGPIGSTWNFKVRAMAENDNLGAFSSVFSTTIVAPVVNMLPPSRPSLNTASGLVLVAWDGTVVDIGNPADETDDISTAAPAYLASVDIQASVNSGTNWQTVGFLTKGTRVQSVSGLTVGSPVMIRLVGRDTLGQASQPSPTATITVLGYSGVDIIGGTITGNKIAAGTITTNNISPTFGKDLDISANGTVSIISGQVATVQGQAATNADNLLALRTRYDFTPTEAVISQPNSAFSVAISNSQIEFREGGVKRAFLNGGVFTAPRMASGQLVLKYHIIEDDQTNGTVIRRLS